MFGEFSGKGDRLLIIANSKERGARGKKKKAVGRKRESASNKRIADDKWKKAVGRMQ
jgi:hypothetical protein